MRPNDFLNDHATSRAELQPHRRYNSRTMARDRRNQPAGDPDDPVSYYELPIGTPVHASDGTQVGTVQRIVIHERERLLDGLVVQAADGRRFVDAPEVVSMLRGRVDIEHDVAAFTALPLADGVAAALDGGVRKLFRRTRGSS